ncbi:MAG TPA: iron ABC transporter permease [Marinobacter sp.]|nr:iron ABC transporter permease [Marinobacter sp.]
MPDKRTTIANSILLALMLVAVITSLSMGTVRIDPMDTLRALVGSADPMTTFVVNELRLNRVTAGLLAGAALALAGCLMQTLARNRLATPGIIGIDNAATAFAVASVVGIGVSVAPPVMALAGAAAATAIAFGLAGANGTRGYRFIVAGIGIGAIAGAVTQVMLSRVAIDAANAAYPWTVGSLNARSGNSVLVLACGLAAGYGLLMLISRGLNTLQFSDAVAVALGTHLKRVRILGLAISVLLTGFAVSVCGPVGLIALLAPELARTICKPGKVPLLASALAGATFMVVADLLGRTLFSPLEIPVGIITAIVGSPYLLWILLKPSQRSLT